jgi:Ribophorin I
MLFFVLLACASISQVASVVNKDVQRTIDATTSMVKIFIDIKAEEVKKDYELVFPTEEAAHLAFLSVSRKGKELPISAPVA